MSDENQNLFYKADKSAILTVMGVIAFFSAAIIVTLIAPSYVDSSWQEPSSSYQVQMYEVADPNIYLSSKAGIGGELQMVYHVKMGYSLLAFKESSTVRIVAPPELELYITRLGHEELKLTSDLLLLRQPRTSQGQSSYDAVAAAEALQQQLQKDWEQANPNWASEGLVKPRFQIYELYRPNGEEAFAKTDTDGITENWVDGNYKILDSDFPRQDFHSLDGVLYVNNPEEYRIKFVKYGTREGYQFDPDGEPIASLEQLKDAHLGFLSREELVNMGEDIYRIEGCWYCHTDQTRTLVHDVVLNGSESYPAPPSSANEYIYQRVTFPGTRRIGPDLSRVGVKRPSRDWHLSHFWSPKTESAGTIMPAFRHFFDHDPSGTSRNPYGVPNYKFEAVFQYLMTKGTRITPPTQAWWNGKDPVRTIDIIEGRSSAE